MRVPTDEASWHRFARRRGLDPATTSMAAHVDGVLASSWEVPGPRDGLVLVVRGGRSRVVHLVAAG